MAISHCYWHLVVKNGNFTLLLTSSGQEWQLADLPKIYQQIYPPMHHGIYIMGCIWQPCCILQEKVGISCYFEIISVVNNQLAWYSHVKCNPPWHPQHPQNTTKNSKTPPTWQLQISTMMAHICQVSYVILLWKLILADLPLSPQMHHGMYLAAILDSSRKGGNFLLFLNN